MTKKKSGIKIIEIACHRNGVSGMPFNVVRFDCKDNGRMVGIVLPKETDEDTGLVNCFVLNIDKLDEDVISFGENSWRGDDYAKELRAAIKRAR